MAQLTHAPSGSLAYTFVDEEELLGFKIWVAELELLVRGGRACGQWPCTAVPQPSRSLAGARTQAFMGGCCRDGRPGPRNS